MRWHCGSVLLVQIANERPRAHRMVPNASLQEIAAYRCLREKCHFGAGLERVQLREDFAEVCEIARVVTFAGLELNNRQVH